MAGFVYIAILMLGVTLLGLTRKHPSGNVGPLLFTILVLGGAWFMFG